MRLFVYEQDNSKTYGRILSDFGSVLDHLDLLDP